MSWTLFDDHRTFTWSCSLPTMYEISLIHHTFWQMQSALSALSYRTLYASLCNRI